MRISYARVSTDDQSLNLQIDALRAANVTRIFTDKLSGKSRKRPGLAKALAALRASDTIVVWRLDRIGRNFRDLVDIADECASAARTSFRSPKGSTPHRASAR